MSSVDSMLRRVVLGDSAICCGRPLEVVMMIGLALVGSWPGSARRAPGSGEVASEGPFGVDVLDRRSMGVDFEAAFCSAFARSGSCMRVVRSDRREVKFGRESTRAKS